MRFGVTLTNNWGVTDVEGLVALGPWLESLGYHSVWVNHHVLNIGYVRDRLEAAPYHDAFTVLSWVAAQTRTIRLGTSVLVLPYLHPMSLAKTLATLDQLSGGRVIAGVGVGSLQAEHDLLNLVPFEERGAYSDEFLEVMQALWTQQEPVHTGRYFRLEGALFSPKPRQSPLPIVVGGNRRPALRRVARFAQGWHPLGVSVESLAARRVILDEELAKVGRTRAEIELSLRWDIKPDRDLRPMLDAYQAEGVDEIVWSLGTPDLDLFRRTFERLAAEVVPAFS
ncbi:MAG: TIGR03619 family F420-dependent LLM class oxidoreductase [Acidimicrobiales bacterium]